MEVVRHYRLGDALLNLRVWGLTVGYSIMAGGSPEAVLSPESPRPDRRATVSRREASGEGPQRLAPVFGAGHQNSDARRWKIALCAKVPHPSPCRPGEVMSDRGLRFLPCGLKELTVGAGKTT